MLTLEGVEDAAGAALVVERVEPLEGLEMVAVEASLMAVVVIGEEVETGVEEVGIGVAEEVMEEAEMEVVVEAAVEEGVVADSVVIKFSTQMFYVLLFVKTMHF